ncbi:MAG: hypothetical protein AAF657_18040, partial [Acidobacteriota bacterium]
MSSTPSTRRPKELGLLLLLFVVSLALRLPAAVQPPAPWVYDSDELVFLGSLLGLLGGETPHALQWPAATLHLALLPFVLLHFALTAEALWPAIAATDPYAFADALTLYLGNAFYDPLSLLVPMRILLAGATSFTAPLAFHYLPARFDRGERLMAALVLASSPVLVRQTALVKGDSLGLLFWTLALTLLLARDRPPQRTMAARRAAILSALHLGLATASRLTLLAAWPLLPLYAWWTGPRRQLIRIASLSLGAFALPILIFLPFFWTQPFTFLKAVLGNVLLLSRQDGGGQSLTALLVKMIALAGPVAIVLAVAGLAMLWRRRERRDLAALTTVAFVLFLIPLARSGHLPPHYTLPFLPILSLWCGVGAATVTRWATRTRPGAARPLLLALAGAVIAVNTVDVFGWHRAMQRPVSKVGVAEWLVDNTQATERLAMPTILATYLPPNKTALEEILRRYREQPASATARLPGLLGAVGSRSATTREPSFLLDAWLIDDEAIDIFRYRAMRHAAIAGAAPPNA